MQDHIGFYSKCERDGQTCFDLNFFKITLATLSIMDSMLEGKIVQSSS